MRHDFADGKYTVISDNGKLTALRHGEPWPARDEKLVGDKLVYWMLVKVDELTDTLNKEVSDRVLLAKLNLAMMDDITKLRHVVTQARTALLTSHGCYPLEYHRDPKAVEVRRALQAIDEVLK